MLFLLLLVASVDSAKLKPVEVDYIAPIERYLDSSVRVGDMDEDDREIEHRHLHEKNPRDGKVWPTYYISPFTRFDWCELKTEPTCKQA